MIQKCSEDLMQDPNFCITERYRNDFATIQQCSGEALPRWQTPTSYHFLLKREEKKRKLRPGCGVKFYTMD